MALNLSARRYHCRSKVRPEADPRFRYGYRRRPWSVYRLAVPGASSDRLFAVMYFRCRSPLVSVAALAWLAYFPYEQAMKLRILCSGECNIRVDLLLLYPLLALVSLLAIVAYVRRDSNAKPG
jgi:hypothetical protein